MKSKHSPPASPAQSPVERRFFLSVAQKARETGNAAQ